MWIGINKDSGAKQLIEEVESGLACNCVCAECGEPLVAKKGEVVQHHFAHASGMERENCSETVLHLFAKEIIARQTIISFPEIDHIDFQIDQSQVNDKGEVIISDLYTQMSHLPVVKSALEVRIQDFQPDVLVKVKTEYGEYTVAVEVAVTHFVDEVKKNKVSLHDISMIEIDCSDMLNKHENSEDARNDILEKLAHSAVWLQISKSFIDAIRSDQVERLSPKETTFYNEVKAFIKEQEIRGVIDLPYFNFDTRFKDYRSLSQMKLKTEWLKRAPKVWLSYPIMNVESVEGGWMLTLYNRKSSFKLPVYIGEKAMEAHAQGISFLTVKEIGDNSLTWNWGYNAKAERFVRDLTDELIALQEKASKDVVSLINRIEKAAKHGFPVIPDKEQFNAQSFHLARKLLETTDLDIGNLLIDFDDQTHDIFGFENKLWQFYVLEILRQNAGSILSVNDIVNNLLAFGIEPLPLYRSIFYHRKDAAKFLPEWTRTLQDEHQLVKRFCQHLTNATVNDKAILIKKTQSRYSVLSNGFKK